MRASRQEGERAALVFACQAVKDVEGALGELLPVADELVICPLPDSGGQEGGPGAEPRHVAGIAATLGGKARIAASLEEAVRMARKSRAERIYICGSVYLCGAALAANGESVT